jgi:hypothetical protein
MLRRHRARALAGAGFPTPCGESAPVRPNLTVVEPDGRPDGAARFGLENLADARQFSWRPGDRCEAVAFRDRDALQEVTFAATRAGIDPRLAVILLAEQHLCASGLDDAEVEHLDLLARRQEVQIRLAPANRAYLRNLRSRVSAGEAPRIELGPLPIPVRLIDRLLSTGPDTCLDADRLPAALNWERAAIASGMTMGEWAANCNRARG